MKSARADMKIIFKCKEHYQFSMFCFSLLVNASNLETVIDHLRSCYTIFCSEYTNESVTQAYQYMKNEFQKLGEESVLDGVVVSDDDDKHGKEEKEEHPETEEEIIVASNKKPFLPYINSRLDKCISVCCDKSFPVNKLYQPKFKEVMEKKWIGLIPFWGSILRGDPARYRNWKTATSNDGTALMSKQNHRTSGSIEAWNLILKCSDHPKHRLRPDLFIRDHQKILVGRQMSYIDKLSSTKQIILKKRKKKQLTPLKEVWSKRVKKENLLHPEKGHYQQPPSKDFDLMPVLNEATNETARSDVHIKDASNSSSTTIHRINVHSKDASNSSSTDSKTSHPSAAVIIYKKISNKGFLNSSLHMLCWLNSSLQIILNTSLLLFLTGIPTAHLTPEQHEFLEISRELLSGNVADASVLACSVLDNTGLSGGDALEGTSKLVNVLLCGLKDLPGGKSLFDIDIKRTGICEKCNNRVQEMVDHNMIYCEIPSVDRKQFSLSFLLNQTLTFMSSNLELQFRRCPVCDIILTVKESRIKFPDFLLICNPRLHANSHMKFSLSVERHLNNVQFITEQMKNYSLVGLLLHHEDSEHYTAIVWNGYGWTSYSDHLVQEKSVNYHNSSFVQENVVLALYAADKHSEPYISKLEGSSPTSSWRDCDLFASKIVPHTINEYHKDLQCLKPGNWLLSEVISSYLLLLVDQCNKEGISLFRYDSITLPKLIATGHRGIARYTKGTNIFSKDYLFFPIHQPSHWILVVVDVKRLTMYYVDPLHGLDPTVLNWIWYYLNEESIITRNIALDKREWQFSDSKNLKVPLQRNSYDCGVLMCMACKCFAFKRRLTYTESDADFARRQMYLELMNNEIYSSDSSDDDIHLKLSVTQSKSFNPVLPEDQTSDIQTAVAMNSDSGDDQDSDISCFEFEEDPVGSGLLVPDFLNEYHPVDEDEELYGVKWGKEVYLQTYPKLHRPSDENCLFTRDFVRNSVKHFEPTLRMLLREECYSVFTQHHIRNKLKSTSIHAGDLWPLELEDMMTEVTHYVMGIQSDHYKTGATLLTDVVKFVLIPELLTGLLMDKFNLKYDDAVMLLIQRKLPKQS